MPNQPSVFPAYASGAAASAEPEAEAMPCGETIQRGCPALLGGPLLLAPRPASAHAHSRAAVDVASATIAEIVPEAGAIESAVARGEDTEPTQTLGTATAPTAAMSVAASVAIAERLTPDASCSCGTVSWQPSFLYKWFCAGRESCRKDD